jgi:hypothetical protein
VDQLRAGGAVTAIDPGPPPAEPRRTVLLAAAASVPIFLTASLLQLRPFVWDTARPGLSLLEFQKNKNPMQLGGWSRISLVLPLLFLAVALTLLLERWGRIQSRVGGLLLVASGFLGVVSGVAQSVMGVFAEDYLPADPGARAHALAADALFWVHDNLATLSLIVLSVGAVILAPAMRKAGFARRTVWAGRLALPFSTAMSVLFVMKSSRKGSLLYLVPWGGAVALLTLWMVGIIVDCRGAFRRPVTDA